MPTEALARLVHDAMGYESHETLKVLDEQEIKDKDELFEYWHDLKELARTAQIKHGMSTSRSLACTLPPAPLN